MADVLDLAGALKEALILLEREAPRHFWAMGAQLGERAAVIRLGSERPVRVSMAAGPPWVTDGERGDIEIRLSHADLDAFLRGRFTLEEAIESDRLYVRAALDDLLPFFDALACWLHGALRCPSFPALHRRCLAASRTKEKRAKS